MVESVSKEDAFRHVRFAGRPAIAVPRLPGGAKPLPPTAGHAPAHRPEEPGFFISWVFERAGLAVESYRGEPLQRRLSACLRALHTKTEAQARQILEERPGLLPVAIGALLIGVTEFFRDPPVFETLRTVVLPEMASLSRPLRVWSAGCSTGAELYSVAVLLAEAGLLAGSFLLGSDCRHDAIENAQAALYSTDELRKIEPPARGKYFTETGGFHRPVERLCRRVHWKVADLTRRIEGGPWDMILWRNMAIYLKAEAAAPVWRDLVSVLAPGGVLVVGRAERPPAELPLDQVRRCVYRSSSRDGGPPLGRSRRGQNTMTREPETVA